MTEPAQRYFDRSPTFIHKDLEPLNDCFETVNREMMQLGSHLLLRAIHDALLAREERIQADRTREEWSK